MLGFITALALTYFGVRYMRHRYHGGGGRQWRRRRREWVLDRMSSTLGTKPSQDRVLEEVVDDVMDAFAEEKTAFRSSRGKVAEFLQADEFDGPALDELLASQKAALDRLQTTVADSLKKAHETLDSEQRAVLGRYLAHRGHGCGRRAHAA